MPAASKQQQKFVGIVRAIQKGDVPASKFSKAAQKAAKSMDKKSVKKYAATKHDDLPKKVKEMYESILNENPAVIATAARMAIQNKQGKKVSVNTARQSSYASKDPSAHKKAKSIFQRIKDKFKKKDKPAPKKQSKSDVDFYKRQFAGESIDEGQKRESINIMNKFDQAYLKFSREIRDVIKMVDKSTASKVDGKIIEKAYGKGLIPLNKLMQEWGRGQLSNPGLDEANNMDKIKDIVKKKQFKRIGGVIIDMQTANAIMKVHQALTGANKKRYEKLSISKMADIAYKLIK